MKRVLMMAVASAIILIVTVSFGASTTGLFYWSPDPSDPGHRVGDGAEWVHIGQVEVTDGSSQTLGP